MAGSGSVVVTRQFALLVAATLSYFIGLGLIAPVLPLYVEEVLDGGGAHVGIAVGAFAVSAALLRPWVGRVGDQRGRRVLIVGGMLVAGLSILGYGIGESLVLLVLLRLVTGAGEAAAFVGAATTSQDLAPPDRRGQAASIFSISIYGGLALGPPIGEWLYDSYGHNAAWLAAAGFCLLGSALATTTPAFVDGAGPGDDDEPTDVEPAPRTWLHRDGLRPGVILALGASGYAGFSSFVPLYVDEIGVDGAGPAFILYAVVVLGVRILGSRLPDVLGTRRGPLLSLALQATGLVSMGVFASPAGLYASTAVYALGVSLLYPALFRLVIDAAPDRERSHAVATFTLFFDVSQGLGAPLLGTVVALGNERVAFVAAGLLSAIGFVLHRSATSPSQTAAGSRAGAGDPAPGSEGAPGQGG